MNYYEQIMLEDAIEWAKNIEKRLENTVEIIKIKKTDFDNLVQENQQLKELLKKLYRDAQEIVLYSHDIADIDQEDWFTISRRQADVANNIAKDIYNAIGGK